MLFLLQVLEPYKQGVVGKGDERVLMRLDSVLIMKQQQTKRGANKRFNELGDQQNVKV